jgi:hypothetical protein
VVIVNGRENQVVARCRDIYAAASANVDALADYGVGASKLTKLKSKTDAFETLLARPRQNITASSAATKALPQRFDEADQLLAKRLDRLMAQFKATAPEFVSEYFAARSIVDNAASRTAKPAPAPAPAV